MKRFGYGINSYHKTASILVEFSSWYIFLLQDLTSFLCRIIPPLPLPPLPLRLINKESIEFNDGKKWTTLREWCGDLSSTFCLLICNKVESYCYGHIETKTVDISYGRARRIFYQHDQKRWDEHEKEMK